MKLTNKANETLKSVNGSVDRREDLDQFMFGALRGAKVVQFTFPHSTELLAVEDLSAVSPFILRDAPIAGNIEWSEPDPSTGFRQLQLRKGSSVITANELMSR